MWRAIRGKLLARSGDLEKAGRLAQEAVEISSATDQVSLRGDLLLDLAEVLGMAGKSEDSRACIRQALELYGRKGNVTRAAAARELLARNG